MKDKLFKIMITLALLLNAMVDFAQADSISRIAPILEGLVK